MPQNLRGFDVSDNQGPLTAAGWQQAKAAGHVFAIVKVTDGLTYVDKHGLDNIKYAKDAGFAVAAYHFTEAGDDGGNQAKFFLETIAPVEDLLGGPLADGIILPYAAMDLEDVKPNWTTFDLAARTARVSNFLAAVDGHFQTRTLIYTAPGWFDEVFPGVDWSGHPLWVAAPGVEQAPTCGAWKSVFCWQYSWTGSVPGITEGGDLDLDVIYDPN